LRAELAGVVRDLADHSVHGIGLELHVQQLLEILLPGTSCRTASYILQRRCGARRLPEPVVVSSRCTRSCQRRLRSVGVTGVRSDDGANCTGTCVKTSSRVWGS
jgi:hypothetical protein